MKKVISFILAATMVAMLVGCSESKTAQNTTAAGSDQTKTASTNASQTSSKVKWPKNVEIVVPASAGGDTDYNARLFAQLLSEKLGSNFVVSNVSGNGGATGTRQVKNADNDGSSVLFYHSAFVVNNLCGTTDYGFDAYNFACIAAMNPGNVLTVNSSLGIKSLDELIQYSKKNPGKLKLAAQSGATSYAVAVQLKQAGLDVNIVDAGSASDRLAALLGGHVDIIFAPYGSIKDYVTEGKFVPLASDGLEGITKANVKSIMEQGCDVALPFYYFFAFPKGTNQALVDEFNAAVKEIVETDTDYADKIATSYYQKPTFYGPKEGLEKFNEVYKTLKNVKWN